MCVEMVISFSGIALEFDQVEKPKDKNDCIIPEECKLYGMVTIFRAFCKVTTVCKLLLFA